MTNKIQETNEQEDKIIIARPIWVRKELLTARATINEALEELEKNGDVEFWIDEAKLKLNSALDGINH